MEGAPFIPEQHDERTEDFERHLTNSEKIGSLAFEADSEKDPDYRRQNPERLGQALIGKEVLQNKTESAPEKDPTLRSAHKSDSTTSKVPGAVGSLLSSKTNLSLNSSTSQTDTMNTKSTTKKKTNSTKLNLAVADIVMLSVILLLLFAVVAVAIVRL